VFFSNGVGAPVAMSIANSEDNAQDLNMDDLQCSGWTDTNTKMVANNDDSKSSDNDKDEEGLKLLAPISFPNIPYQRTPQTTSPNLASPSDSAVPSHFSAFAPKSRTSQIGPHRNTSSHKSRATSSPIKAPCHVGCRSASGGSIKEKLLVALDPASREERDHQNSLVRFYLMQVCDANKTIEKLRDKILRLQSGDQKKVTDLQEKVTTLQEKLTELKIENEVLKS
jgi:hypothetical protein